MRVIFEGDRIPAFEQQKGAKVGVLSETFRVVSIASEERVCDGGLSSYIPVTRRLLLASSDRLSIDITVEFEGNGTADRVRISREALAVDVSGF